MAIMFMVAELVGAVLGVGLLRLLTPDRIFLAAEQGTCVTLIHPEVTLTQGFFLEFFLTSALMSIICGVWDPRNRENGDAAPLRIGEFKHKKLIL